MASTLVQETVISHVDNCKIFQYWLLFFQFASLQSLLYVLAILLFYNHISDHITSCLKHISLHYFWIKSLFLNMLISFTLFLPICPSAPDYLVPLSLSLLCHRLSAFLLVSCFFFLTFTASRFSHIHVKATHQSPPK